MGGQQDRLPRPSLFITCRLAQVVQKVKHRLQQRLQTKRKGANPYGASYQRGLRLRALSDLEKVSVPRRCQVELTSPVDNASHEKWVNSLLHDLDDNTHLKVYSLTKIAANDGLLLSHSKDTLVETFLQRVTLPQAAYLFDLTTLLLSRIDAVRSKGAFHSDVGLEYEPKYKRLQDEVFLANLTHLLRRLQYMLLQTLVRRSLQALDECANHWNSYWLQRKKADDGWFAEWPDSQPPFSSTMPWNIKPSLVVLWGVCWMFYPSGSGAEQENVPSQPVLGGADFWQWSMHRPAFPGESSQPAAAASNYAQADEASMALNPFGDPGQTGIFVTANQPLGSFPQPQGITQPAPNTQGIYPPFGRQTQLGLPPNTFAATAGPYQAPYNNEGTAAPTASFLSRDSRWPDSSRGNFLYASSVPQQSEPIPTSDVWPPSQYEALYPIQTSSSIPNFTVSPVSAPPSTQHLLNTLTSDISPNRNLSLPVELSQAYDFSMMGGAELESGGYPSPHSVKNEDVEFDRRMSVTSQSSGAPLMSTAAATHDANLTTSPSSEGSRLKLSIKREEPPRNAEGLLVCQHPECQQERPVFRRSCEWNKHMDKHERPYKCPDPACDKIQGFTYSGGLLRHQREVHKKNATARKLLFCPVGNCNRNIEQGHGFTRKENLNEHMRRRHAPGGSSHVDVAGLDLYEATSPDVRQTLQFTQQESPMLMNKKRKRAEADEDEEGQTPELPSGSRRGSVFAVPPKRESSSGENFEHIDLSERLVRVEHESRRKDERIRQLENIVRQLRAQLQMGARQQGLGMT